MITRYFECSLSWSFSSVPSEVSVTALITSFGAMNHHYFNISPCRAICLVHSRLFMTFFINFLECLYFTHIQMLKEYIWKPRSNVNFSYFEHNKVSRKYQALKDLESSLTKKLLKNAQMLIFWKKIKSMKLKKSIFSLLLPSNCFPFVSHCSKHSINFNPMKSQDFWIFFCYFKKLYWFHGGAR